VNSDPWATMLTCGKIVVWGKNSTNPGLPASPPLHLNGCAWLAHHCKEISSYTQPKIFKILKRKKKKKALKYVPSGLV
jgi:hypothetical protein